MLREEKRILLRRLLGGLKLVPLERRDSAVQTISVCFLCIALGALGWLGFRSDVLSCKNFLSLLGCFAAGLFWSFALFPYVCVLFCLFLALLCCVSRLSFGFLLVLLLRVFAVGFCP